MACFGLVWFLALAGLCLVGMPARALEAAELDQLAVDQIAYDVGDKKKVRVVTDGERLEVLNPTLHAWGIQYTGQSEEESAAGRVPWGNVRELQVQKSAAGRGALAGGMVFGIAGLALGLASTGECSGGLFSSELCGASTTDVVTITLVGTVGGAALGGLIGAPIKVWKTVYRGKAPQPEELSMSVVGSRDGGVGVVLRMVPG